jgi:hypothetical protein
MPVACEPLRTQPPHETAATRQSQPAAVTFQYVQSESFVALLHELGASLLVSTYQANKLLVVRAAHGGLSTLVRTFQRPMGIAVDTRRLALGTHSEVWLMRNAPDIAQRVEPAGRHDACYLPRSCHVTGDIGVHEIAWVSSPPRTGPAPRPMPLSPEGRDENRAPGSAATIPARHASEERGEDELWIVSTRFSCLCTLHPDYSFVPRWWPPFITTLAAEDRCHLNGLAVVAGQPGYVTALSTTDTRDGWRPGKASGGCIVDVASGELVVRGLSMPHSPRWHEGRLWMLESGTGQLLRVDVATGQRQTVVQLPGFARGLAFCGPYAFVGLSKIRPTSAMDGVPLAQRRDQLKCGIAVVDLRRGEQIGLLEFQTAVEEIFDVQLLSGGRFPEVVGFQQDTIQHTFVVPTQM